MKDKNGREVIVGDCAFYLLHYNREIRYEFGVFKVVELKVVKDPKKKKQDFALLHSIGTPMRCWKETNEIISMPEDEAMFFLLKNAPCAR